MFLHVTHHLSPGEIVRLLKVGKTFVHKVLKLYSETKGVEYSLNHNRGKPPSVVNKLRSLYTVMLWIVIRISHFLSETMLKEDCFS